MHNLLHPPNMFYHLLDDLKRAPKDSWVPAHTPSRPKSRADIFFFSKNCLKASIKNHRKYWYAAALLGLTKVKNCRFQKSNLFPAGITMTKSDVPQPAKADPTKE